MYEERNFNHFYGLWRIARDLQLVSSELRQLDLLIYNPTGYAESCCLVAQVCAQNKYFSVNIYLVTTYNTVHILQPTVLYRSSAQSTRFCRSTVSMTLAARRSAHRPLVSILNGSGLIEAWSCHRPRTRRRRLHLTSLS